MCLVTAKILFKLITVDVQTDFSLNLNIAKPKDSFLASRPVFTKIFRHKFLPDISLKFIEYI